MKKIILFLLLIFPLFANSLELCQSRATVIQVGYGMYYDPGNAGMLQSALVWDSTSAVASWTCRLLKGIGELETLGVQQSTNLTLAASGSTHDCSASVDKSYSLELTADDTNTLGGLEVLITYTGRLPMRNVCDLVVVPTATWIANHNGSGLAGMIASVSNKVTADSANILSNVGAWVFDATTQAETNRADLSGRIASGTASDISLHAITDGLIQEVTPYVVAGSRIVPSTGCTPLEFYTEQYGQAGCIGVWRGYSLNSATPTVDLMSVIESNGAETTPLYKDAFTYGYYDSQETIGGATIYCHYWKYDFGNISRERQYTAETIVQSEGKSVHRTAQIIFNPTPSITYTQNPLTETAFNATIAGITQDLINIMLDDRDFMIYTGVEGVTRAINGQSTWDSLYSPAGNIWGVTIAAYEWVTGATFTSEKVYDYNSTNNQRAKQIPVIDLKSAASVNSVTVTAPGQE